MDSANLVGMAIAALPGVLAYVTRNRAVRGKIEQVANESTVRQFNLLYDEARKQVTECREENAKLRDEGSKIRAELELARSREDKLDEKVEELEREIREVQAENRYLKGLVVRLQGGGP